jgi:hypothetical protein
LKCKREAHDCLRASPLKAYSPAPTQIGVKHIPGACTAKTIDISNVQTP